MGGLGKPTKLRGVREISLAARMGGGWSAVVIYGEVEDGAEVSWAGWGA